MLLNKQRNQLKTLLLVGGCIEALARKPGALDELRKRFDADKIDQTVTAIGKELDAVSDEDALEFTFELLMEELPDTYRSSGA